MRRLINFTVNWKDCGGNYAVKSQMGIICLSVRSCAATVSCVGMGELLALHHALLRWVGWAWVNCLRWFRPCCGELGENGWTACVGSGAAAVSWVSMGELPASGEIQHYHHGYNCNTIWIDLGIIFLQMCRLLFRRYWFFIRVVWISTVNYFFRIGRMLNLLASLRTVIWNWYFT